MSVRSDMFPRRPALSRAKDSAAKRLTDIVLAVLVLLLASPVLLLVGAVIAVTMGRPVFFTQERTGLSGRQFRMIKFRTMTDARDADGRLLPDGARTNAVGRLLRRSSLDELPELINVIRGEMSLVGPRPLLPRYDDWYTSREMLRFQARPGITGLAQVSGRNSVGWDDRLELDARYVAEWSYPLDLKILALTGWRVVAGSGVAVDPSAAMLDLDLERQARR